MEKRGNTRGRAKSERQVCHLTLAKRKWPRRRQRETEEQKERGDRSRRWKISLETVMLRVVRVIRPGFSNLLIKPTDYPFVIFHIPVSSIVNCKFTMEKLGCMKIDKIRR